jgi:hypothetical protein
LHSAAASVPVSALDASFTPESFVDPASFTVPASEVVTGAGVVATGGGVPLSAADDAPDGTSSAALHASALQAAIPIRMNDATTPGRNLIASR